MHSSSISKRNICVFHTTIGLNQSVYLDLNIRTEQLQDGTKDKLSLLGKEVQQY